MERVLGVNFEIFTALMKVSNFYALKSNFFWQNAHYGCDVEKVILQTIIC